MTSPPTNADLDAWSSLQLESGFSPSTPIIDPHHHLFPPSRKPTAAFDAKRHESFGRASTSSGYLREDMERDAAHVRVVATVHVETRSGRGPEVALAESRFVKSVFDQNPKSDLTRGVVCAMDLTMDRGGIEKHVEEHLMVFRGSKQRLCGVRCQIANHDEYVSPALPGKAMLCVEGARVVGELGLTVDVWLYHTQILNMVGLCAAAPNTMFVCDHCAMPLRAFEDQVFEAWYKDMAVLGKRQNVVLKLGGLGMHCVGFTEERALSSNEMLQKFERYFDALVSLFGPDRCMLESNFPMDKACGSYKCFWNACKKFCLRFPPITRRKLLFESANQIYKLDMPVPHVSLYDYDENGNLLYEDDLRAKDSPKQTKL